MTLFKDTLLKYSLFLLILLLVLGFSYILLEESVWKGIFNSLAYCSISKSRLVIYLAVLTTIAAVSFAVFKKYRTWTFAIYLGLLTLSGYGLFHTVFVDGKIRSIYLYQYKFKHIKVGKLYYRPGWGWVDKVHYRSDHYEELMKKFNEAKGDHLEVDLSDSWRTPLGFKVNFTKVYRIDLSKTKDRWAVITGIMMDFMAFSEQTQADSPWYHGNQLSAWQFDDMTSNLLACLDQESTADLNSIRDIPELNKIWQKEGLAKVERKVTLETVWEYLGKDKAGIKERVKRAKSSWERLSLPAS